jgi:hypothetical protein
MIISCFAEDYKFKTVSISDAIMVKLEATSKLAATVPSREPGLLLVFRLLGFGKKPHPPR